MPLITTATTTDGQLNPQNKQMVQITAPFQIVDKVDFYGRFGS